MITRSKRGGVHVGTNGKEGKKKKVTQFSVRKENDRPQKRWSHHIEVSAERGNGGVCGYFVSGKVSRKKKSL